MNAGEAELASIDDWGGEDAVIARPQLDVTVRKLPAGGAAFLQALATAPRLATPRKPAVTDHPEFDLAANLAGLIGAGLATDLSITSLSKRTAHHEPAHSPRHHNRALPASSSA